MKTNILTTNLLQVCCFVKLFM